MINPKQKLSVLALCIVSLLIFSGCATTSGTVDYRPNAVVETLSSAVALSVQTSDRGMSGQGYMVFRKPDQVHLVVLSPFGTTIMEVFALGKQITLIFPSKATAYTGSIDELPDGGGLQGWRMMRWVMDADPSNERHGNGTVERMGKLGFIEKVTYADGLITSKSAPNGDQVFYEKYEVIGGVPVAVKVEMRNIRDDRVRLTLNEPEVNTALEDAVFIPQLEGFTILPLSDLKGL
ncbi:outer membrane lipoprotein LolB [Pelotalea chapellei]|uniref:Outer-membrane lipoprotein LolB n=1 Tax=Pelotalea chapellei TaxID=44671 RepID=A0ABS5U741_9BACT|nr:outer membrane lipoprotein LolB [Pelotalea chapellei]MBT1071476.1 outer membrane lipoprotein LolB [Pelotalea chapellei]